MSVEQRQGLLTILLAQIKPFIKKKNITLPDIKGMNILIVNEKTSNVLPSNTDFFLIWN